MRTQIRLDGRWLADSFDVSGVKHSTIFRREGWSGDYQASCSFAAPADFEAPWFAEGKRFEVIKGGRVLWSGVLSERSPGDSWDLHAFGHGSLAENFDAIDSTADGWTASSKPDDVVDSAIARGWGVARIDSFGTASVSTAQGDITNVAVLLNRAAQNLGKRWGVDSTRGLRLLDEPMTPTWVVSPGDAYLGTVDDEYLTTLRGWYVASVDADGAPATFGMVTSTDTAAVEKFGGVRERTVDLRGLGLLAPSIAQTLTGKRLALVGGRTGWTNTVTLSSQNVRHIGGAWAEPSMVKAGQMLRIPGVMDTRSSPIARANIDVALAEVEHDEDSGTSTAVPLGYVPRDFSGALAAAPVREKPVEVA